MTSTKYVGHETIDDAEWPGSHRRKFLGQLIAQGYVPYTIRQYERTISRFCEEIEKHCLGVGALDGPATENLREAVLSNTTDRARTHAKYCLGRFIEHLVEAGAASLPEPPFKEPTAMDCLREEYDAYLRRQRGLSEATIYHCMRFLARFMAFRFGEMLGDLNTIMPDEIVAFLCQLKAGSRPYRDKTPPSHLRNLFKFLFWSGKTKRNLANSIPRLAQNKPSHLPRYLKPEEVRQLIDAMRTNDAIGRRNYAMLLLIARLGLRAPEVIAIQLDDVDWRAGEILIRGKGKLHDRMPVPIDVGEAIVDYIKNGRAGISRALFVSGAGHPTNRLRMPRSSMHCWSKRSKEPASSRPRSMWVLMCFATVSQLTCFVREHRSMRSAMFCGIDHG
jgi:site-specific recombinase XerC